MLQSTGEDDLAGPGSFAERHHLDQLMGYLQVQDTKALLLLLVERSDFQRAQRSVTAALRGRPDFIDEGETPVEGWPLLRFHRGENVVEVCLATVSTAAAPRHPDSARRAKAKPSG